MNHLTEYTHAEKCTICEAISDIVILQNPLRRGKLDAGPLVNF